VELTQKICINTVNLVDDLIALSLDPSTQNIANKSVGLRDTDKFNIIVNFCSQEELREARQELVSAIKFKDWSQGFLIAIRILSMFGGK